MKESKTENIGTTTYCSFCGEEAKEDVSFEEYTRYSSHYCTCEGAKLYMKALELFQKAESYVDKEKINDLKYEAKLRQLKYKFGKDQEE